MLYFPPKNPEVAYPSEHRTLPDPEKAFTVAHYERMAKMAAMETSIGHAVLEGATDVSGAMVDLERYEHFLNAGEPKIVRAFDSDMGSTDIVRGI